MTAKKETAKAKGSTTTTNNSTSNSNSNMTGKPTPNAWSRPLKTRPPPGLAVPTKTKSMQDQILRERFLHLSLSMVGQKVTLTQNNGAILEGIFHTFTPFDSQPEAKRNKYVLKAVQVIQKGNGDFVNIEKGSTVIIPAEKVTVLHVKSMRLETTTGSKEGFRTDAEISYQQRDKGRDLVSAGNAWTAGGSNSRADALLGGSESGPRKGASSAALRGNIGEWDQFRANEELFDVVATFDENVYTTELDKSTLDRSKLKEAERLAREIEATTSSNIHVAEERNQVIGGDYDEEDRYSGVLTPKLEARNKDGAKKMNYAAAAAKADATKPTPPGFTKPKEEEEKKEPKETPITKDVVQPVVVPKIDEVIVEEPKSEEIKEEPKVEVVVHVEEPKLVVEVVKVEEKKEEEQKDELKTDTKEAEKKPEPKLKLNANAKSFSFNPTAKTFTPTYGAVPLQQPPVPIHETHMIDPNTGMPIMPHQMLHYIQHPMGQQGMMPQMMNAQFATMRYPGPYPGMEQRNMNQGQMHHQPQHQLMSPHMPPFVPPEGVSVTPIVDEQSQNVDGQPVHPQQALPQQPGVPMQYPPNPYYGGGMPMHPGQPRAPHMGGYHPQMVGVPPQITVVPGRNAYQPMYGMPQQPPPHLRGPNGPPYYPPPPQMYPHYVMGDDGGGGRGRGRGRGGQRKPSGRGGRGARGYNQNYNLNGRHTPQNGPDALAPGGQSHEGEAEGSSSSLHQDTVME